MLEIICI